MSWIYATAMFLCIMGGILILYVVLFALVPAEIEEEEK